MVYKQLASPMPGIFFRRTAPDAPPYKQEGDSVAAGDVIGVVEVMKTFFEVKADAAGKVVRFLVEDDAIVEAGQPLVE